MYLKLFKSFKNMMLKRYIIVLFCILLLSGCNSKEEVDVQISGTNITNNYVKEVFLSDNNKVMNPSSILISNDIIYVLNKGSDSITLFDTEGEYINEIGGTGNGPGEFIYPMTIAMDEYNNIFVGDEGNKRVQVLDSSGNYLREYPINQLDIFGCYLNDMEVDKEGNIYLSFKAFSNKKAKILKIDINGNTKRIGKNVMGALGKNKEGEIYFANTYSNDGDNSVVTRKARKAFISHIENDKLKTITYLEDGYAPSDIVFLDDMIILFRASKNHIESFALSGLYQETLYSDDVPDDSLFSYRFATNSKGEIFASNQESSEIYRFRKKD